MPLEKKTNYVLFTLSHSMLNVFHQSMQAQKLTGELLNMSFNDASVAPMVKEWVANGSNCEVFNGGNSYSLCEIWKVFEMCKNEGMPLPIVYHKMSNEMFDGALTSVGVLVSDEIFTHPGYREFNLNFEALCKTYSGYPFWKLHLMVMLRSLQAIR